MKPYVRHVFGPSILLLSALALPAEARQGTVTTFTGGNPAGISADGNTVVGTGGGGGFFWTASGGVVSIGQTGATGTNADGTVIVGNMVDINGRNTAGVWSASTGWVEVGGFPATAGCGSDLSSGYDISSDGTIAVGLGWLQCKARGFRWTSATGSMQLPQLGTNSSRASTISGDGMTIGGFDEATNGTRRASLWLPNGTESLPLADASNPSGYGEVLSLNSDGTMFAGNNLNRAVRWSSSSGTRELEPLPGQSGKHFATALSDDGRVLVGSTGFATAAVGFLWTEAEGTHTFDEYLGAYGVTIPSGVNFGIPTGISADGSTVCGWGFFSPAWVVTLPSTPWSNLGFALPGVKGDPHFYGFGPLTQGSSNSLTLNNAAPTSPALLAISAQATGVPLLGGILVPTPPIISIVLVTDANGEIVLPFTQTAALPSNVPVYLQWLVADGAATQGAAFSNALQVITP